jgi:hypothetical protein
MGKCEKWQNYQGFMDGLTTAGRKKQKEKKEKVI